MLHVATMLYFLPLTYAPITTPPPHILPPTLGATMAPAPWDPWIAPPQKQVGEARPWAGLAWDLGRLDVRWMQVRMWQAQSPGSQPRGCAYPP